VVLNKIKIREIDEVISELHFMCQIEFNSKKAGLGAQLESKEVQAT
jgi:hypothetical protein